MPGRKQAGQFGERGARSPAPCGAASAGRRRRTSPRSPNPALFTSTSSGRPPAATASNRRCGAAGSARSAGTTGRRRSARSSAARAASSSARRADRTRSWSAARTRAISLPIPATRAGHQGQGAGHGGPGLEHESPGTAVPGLARPPQLTPLPGEQHRPRAEQHLEFLGLQGRSGSPRTRRSSLQLHLLPVRVADAQEHRASARGTASAPSSPRRASAAPPRRPLYGSFSSRLLVISRRASSTVSTFLTIRSPAAARPRATPPRPRTGAPRRSPPRP